MRRRIPTLGIDMGEDLEAGLVIGIEHLDPGLGAGAEMLGDDIRLGEQALDILADPLAAFGARRHIGAAVVAKGLEGVGRHCTSSQFRCGRILDHGAQARETP